MINAILIYIHLSLFCVTGWLDKPPLDRQLKNNDITTLDFKVHDTLISFSGFWVNERYIKDIKSSKSPRKSQGNDESCITIPNKTLQIMRIVWGFHDGGEDLVVVKNGNNYQLWDGELKEKFKDIKIISKTKIKIGNNYFVKLETTDKAITDSNPKILEEILFKGTYHSGNGKIVEFKANGQIKGLDNFTHYDPVIDYVGDPDLDVDQISLGKSQNKTNLFGFKFQKSTLLIYQLKCIEYDSANNKCAKVSYGHLIYKLLRIK